MVRSATKLTVYYDDRCGLCRRFLRFARHRDRRGRLRFLPLSTLSASELAEFPETVIVEDADGRRAGRSAAVLRILGKLDRPWPVVARILAAIPRRLADTVYGAVARHRHCRLR